LLTHCINPRPYNFLGFAWYFTLQLWCECGIFILSRISTGGNCCKDHKFAPKFNQATDWPKKNWMRLIFDPATLRAETELKLAAGMERQIYLSFSPVSVVWVPPTCRLSQYPCPKFNLAALLCNIYTAYILKHRSIGATSDIHLFPS